MVDFLANKFQESSQISHREIDASYLDQERARAKLRVFLTVEGSSTFQVMVFTPGKSSFKAATCICLDKNVNASMVHVKCSKNIK